jgi:hypothetical protein
MNNRFIEIYSKNRNRSQFPLTSDFVVPFSNTYQISNPNQAQDPIMNGMIYYTWSSVQNPDGIFHQGFLQPGTTDANPILDQNSFPLPPSDITNAYVGYIFVDAISAQTRLISGYDPQTGQLSLQLSSVNTNPGDPYYLVDYSTASFIHIPAEDENGNKILDYEQAYNGYYIINESMSYGTLIVARKVYYYDNIIRFALLDQPFPRPGWSRQDSYTLRQELPLEKWTLNKDPYFNKDPSYGPIGYVISLPSGSSDVDNFYKDKYIYNTKNIPALNTNYVIKPVLGIYYIKYYKASTHEVFIDVTPETIDLLPKNGYTINIVNYKKNNFSPLDYTGSLTTVSTNVCYEITLIELTLPNVTLKTGSRIAFYPYVYVELVNISASEKASTSIIYSNNPKSNKAVFIAPVTDIVDPITSRFVKLGNNYMTQLIKFKPTDSFKFSVYLPNGKLFETVESDLPPPYAPYNLLQLHAVFSIKRVDPNDEEHDISM